MAKNKKRNRIIIALVIVGVLLLMVVAGAQNRNKKSGTAVEVQTTQLRTLVEKVGASGKIYPEIEIPIIPQVSGEVIELMVVEGDSVRKGAALARINPDIHMDNLARAKAAVLSAQANEANTRARSAQAIAQLENAKLEFERSEKLYQQGVISQTEFQQVQTQYKVAEAEQEAAQQSINAASYNVQSAEASKQEMLKSLNRTTVYAPTSGIISMLNVEEGAIVSGIMQFGSSEMLRIADFNNIEVRVDVSENDILSISLGNEAEVEVDAYQDRIFKGKVTEISRSSAGLASALPTADQATNFTVKIRLDKKSYADLMTGRGGKLPFLPGMSATVEIITQTKKDILSVPIEAVTAREDLLSEAEQKSDDVVIKEMVFLYLEDGTVKTSEVTTGIGDGTFIEIKSGLTNGARVVSGPYSAIHRTLLNEDPVYIDDSEDDSLEK